MSESLATIVGGAAGGLAGVVLLIGFLWFYMSHCKKFSNKSSEAGSSDPSALVEWNREGGSTSARNQSLPGVQGTRQFTLEELEHATTQFNENNLIGDGSFGLVYKGLLHDGTVVAVKRRMGAPQRRFVEEVSYLSEISHRNLVTLLGYSQEDGFQMLVFEYLPNGSVCDHLHGKSSKTQLEFKQRLSIALGAAKGLCHLHSLNPPVLHKNFKTSNVLVDENFIAKVADAGIVKLIETIVDASPSSRTSGRNVFQDTEDGSEMSDIYRYGIFLLEILSGEDTVQMNLLGSGGNMIRQVKSRVASNSIVDSRLAGSFTMEAMKDLISLTLQCLSISETEQPNMKTIVSELEQILEKEMRWKTVMGEGTATVTLGSQLFTTG
ncbi:kinase [Thalictrum thalictroides]|uniref:non-specific serine/threonine protein kinase n=1 Tax=Thalictrum thalictroides TaxID=46969 RepID=A0A7J6X323_THATH|nr:kinase [Thalictrum thalictroides]